MAKGGACIEGSVSCVPMGSEPESPLRALILGHIPVGKCVGNLLHAEKLEVFNLCCMPVLALYLDGNSARNRGKTADAKPMLNISWANLAACSFYGAETVADISVSSGYVEMVDQLRVRCAEVVEEWRDVIKRAHPNMALKSADVGMTRRPDAIARPQVASIRCHLSPANVLDSQGQPHLGVLAVLLPWSSLSEQTRRQAVAPQYSATGCSMYSLDGSTLLTRNPAAASLADQRRISSSPLSASIQHTAGGALPTDAGGATSLALGGAAHPVVRAADHVADEHALQHGTSLAHHYASVQHVGHVLALASGTARPGVLLDSCVQRLEGGAFVQVEALTATDPVTGALALMVYESPLANAGSAAEQPGGGPTGQERTTLAAGRPLDLAPVLQKSEQPPHLPGSAQAAPHLLPQDSGDQRPRRDGGAGRDHPAGVLPELAAGGVPARTSDTSASHQPLPANATAALASVPSHDVAVKANAPLVSHAPSAAPGAKASGPKGGSALEASPAHAKGFVIFHPPPGREGRASDGASPGQPAPAPAAGSRDVPAPGTATASHDRSVVRAAEASASAPPAAPMGASVTDGASPAHPAAPVTVATSGMHAASVLAHATAAAHAHSATASFLDVAHANKDRDKDKGADGSSTVDDSGTNAHEVWMADAEVWQAVGGGRDADKEGSLRGARTNGSGSDVARPARTSTPKRFSTSSVVQSKLGLGHRRRRNSDTKEFGGITQIDASVLVVDDNKVNRTVAGSILRKFFKRVLHAENGMDALHQVVAGIPDLKLIFMDIQMPVLDGNQSTVLIRNHLQSQGLPLVPVVCVTAHASLFSKEQLAKVGYDSCLYKPISVDDVNTVVRGYLEMYLQEEAVHAVSSPKVELLRAANSPRVERAPAALNRGDSGARAAELPRVDSLRAGAPGYPTAAADKDKNKDVDAEVVSGGTSSLPAAHEIRLGLEESHSSSVYSIPSPGPGLSEEDSGAPDYWGRGARKRMAAAQGGIPRLAESPPSARGAYQFDAYRADESGSRSSVGASDSFTAVPGAVEPGPLASRDAGSPLSVDSPAVPLPAGHTGRRPWTPPPVVVAEMLPEDGEDEVILADAVLSPMSSDMSRPAPAYLNRLSRRRLSTSSLSNSADLRLMTGRNRRMSVGPIGSRPSPLSSSLISRSLDSPSSKGEALPGWPTARGHGDRTSNDGERPAADAVSTAGSAQPPLRPPGYVPDDSFAARLLHGVDAATLSMASFPPLVEVAVAPAGPMPAAPLVPLARLSPPSFSHGPGVPSPGAGAIVGALDGDAAPRGALAAAVGGEGEPEVRHSTATLQALMKLKQSHHGGGPAGHHHGGGLGVKVGSLVSGFIRRKSETYPSPPHAETLPTGAYHPVVCARSEGMDPLSSSLGAADATSLSRRQAAEPVRRVLSETLPLPVEVDGGPPFSHTRVSPTDSVVVPRQWSMTEDALRGSRGGLPLGSSYPGGSRAAGSDRVLVPPSSRSAVMGGLWSPGLQHFAENAARQAAASARADDANDGNEGANRKARRRASLGDMPSPSSPMSGDSSILASLMTKLRRRSFRSGLGRISRVSPTPVQPIVAVGFGP